MPAYMYQCELFWTLPQERTEWNKLFSNEERLQLKEELTLQTLAKFDFPREVIEQIIDAIMFCEIKSNGCSIYR